MSWTPPALGRPSTTAFAIRAWRFGFECDSTSSRGLPRSMTSPLKAMPHTSGSIAPFSHHACTTLPRLPQIVTPCTQFEEYSLPKAADVCALPLRKRVWCRPEPSIKAMLWLRCLAVGLDPSNARCTGQFSHLKLSRPKGPLRLRGGVIVVGRAITHAKRRPRSWQREGKNAIVGHGGRGDFVARGERRAGSELLPDDNGLRRARYPEIRPAVNSPGEKRWPAVQNHAPNNGRDHYVVDRS